MRPARVRFLRESDCNFTKRKKYDAFFLEYWQGKRNSLHVRNDAGEIVDFVPFEDFEDISDPDNVLNDYEAVVLCVSDDHYYLGIDLTKGCKYKAIGRDKHGFYLVMDNSCDCYFYPPEAFIILEDEHGLLSRTSVYYSHK